MINDLDENSSSPGGTDKKDNFIRIKRKHICVLLNNFEKISLLFGVKLIHVNKCVSNVSKEVKFACEPDCEDLNPCEVAANIQVSRFATRVRKIFTNEYLRSAGTIVFLCSLPDWFYFVRIAKFLSESE